LKNAKLGATLDTSKEAASSSPDAEEEDPAAATAAGQRQDGSAVDASAKAQASQPAQIGTLSMAQVGTLSMATSQQQQQNQGQ